MKCSDLQLNLSLYTDGFLSVGESADIAQHLEICPLCRQANSDYRELRSEMRRLRRPDISRSLQNSLRSAVQNELCTNTDSALSIPADIRELVQMRLIPYSIGVIGSVLIGFSFLTLMFPGMLPMPPDQMVVRQNPPPSVMLASNSNPFSDSQSAFISAPDFAYSRMAFSSESPSINPQGGLIALTKSMLRGEMMNEEVVVVADVFGNGLATISEVVESPRNSRAVIDLERALQSDPSSAPFVPAVMENRPENMRIVLKFNSVNVSTSPKPSRRRS